MTSSEVDLNTRRTLAKNHDTPTEVLCRLVRDRCAEIRQLAASNPNIPEKELLWLTKDYGDDVYKSKRFASAQAEQPEGLFVQLVTARSTHASPQQLEEYAKSNHKDILVAVGRNLCTPARVLEDLVLNPPPLELRSLSGHTHYDMYAYHFDRNEIFGAIAANPNTPIHTLRELSEKRRGEPDGGIYPVDRAKMTGLAGNPNTPVEILENILKRYDGFLPEAVLTAVVENPATPYSVLADLAYCGVKASPPRLVDPRSGPFSPEERQRLRAYKESLHLRIKQHPNAQAHLKALDEHFAFRDGSQKTASKYINHFVLNESLTKSLIFKDRWIATAHPHTAERTLEHLMHLSDPSLDHWTRQMLQYRVAHHPNVSSQLLEEFTRVLVTTRKLSFEPEDHYSVLKPAVYHSTVNMGGASIFLLAESLHVIEHPKVTTKALDQLQLFCESLVKTSARSAKVGDQVLSAILRRRAVP